MDHNGFHSKAPSSRPAIPPAAVGPGTATSATTKYKHVIFTVPIFKIQIIIIDFNCSKKHTHKISDDRRKTLFQRLFLMLRGGQKS